ncbi:MAG: SDR family oxidoreductase [Bacteroidetes bacterium]|nr:SDR family oxidoreductase [Bacteroidota bacterium]
MKYFIIGSSGFIGSHLCDFFLSKGQEVFKCDVVELINQEKYFCIKSPKHDFDEIFKRNKFDVCINASGSGQVANSFAFPKLDFSLNTINVFSVLDAIRQHNPKCKFLNFSSAAVYGNPLHFPIKESSQISPLSPYGVHKQISELVCKEFFDFFGIDTCNLRVFSAYGIGLKKQIFWDLHQKEQAASNLIELFGTGDETRDFIYIEDVLRIVHLVVENNFFGGNSINVANGEEQIVRSVCEEFLKQSGSTKELVFNGVQKTGDPFRWKADISAVKRLGYMPSIAIDEGISRYVNWLKKMN